MSSGSAYAPSVRARSEADGDDEDYLSFLCDGDEAHAKKKRRKKERGFAGTAFSSFAPTAAKASGAGAGSSAAVVDVTADTPGDG